MALVRLFQFPLDYVTDKNYNEWVSSPFGRNPDRWHNGTDFYAGNGTPLYPIFDGTIYAWGYDANVYGNWVIVKHDDASFSYYYHMVNRSEYDTGQPVQKHHIIGYVGMTGPVTGPHCHVGVSGRGDFTGFVDPVPYILERYWWDDGKPDPTPSPVLKPNQRTTANWDVAGRSQADLNPDNIALIIPPNTVIDCVWWQYGDGAGSGENRFFLVKYQDVQVYVHIGDVIQSGTDGVPEYEGQIKPEPTPDPDKDIAKNLDTIDQATLNIRKIIEEK